SSPQGSQRTNRGNASVSRFGTVPLRLFEPLDEVTSETLGEFVVNVSEEKAGMLADGFFAAEQRSKHFRVEPFDERQGCGGSRGPATGPLLSLDHRLKRSDRQHLIFVCQRTAEGLVDVRFIAGGRLKVRLERRAAELFVLR